jgi:hypothetical protein
MKPTPTAHRFTETNVRTGFTVNRYAFMNSPSRSFDVKRPAPAMAILQTFMMVGMLAAALFVGGKWVDFVAPDSGALQPTSLTQSDSLTPKPRGTQS